MASPSVSEPEPGFYVRIGEGATMKHAAGSFSPGVGESNDDRVGAQALTHTASRAGDLPETDRTAER
jgi:hypothetical protein